MSSPNSGYRWTYTPHLLVAWYLRRLGEKAGSLKLNRVRAKRKTELRKIATIERPLLGAWLGISDGKIAYPLLGVNVEVAVQRG